MADDVSQQIENNALNMIVNFTDKSGSMNKELKKSIYEAVSNLRNLIFILKINLLQKTEENNTMRNGVKQLKDTAEKWKSMSSARQSAPSVISAAQDLPAVEQRSPCHLLVARRNYSPKSFAGKMKFGTH